MTYEEIFSQAKAAFTDKDTSGFKGEFAIQVNIVGEGQGAFYIAFKNNYLDVQPYEYYDRDAILSATAEDFLKISEGTLDAVAAYTTGRLRVDGSIDKALELQKLIQVMYKAEKAKKEAKPAKAPAKTSKKK
ncbi:MAG: SCP2 sterol-binding domain-containing protein [Huintestinicola sp.]